MKSRPRLAEDNRSRPFNAQPAPPVGDDLAYVNPDAETVIRKMRETPVDDMAFKGRIREDGTFVHEMYLAQVKTPEESKRDWDFYTILKSIPGDQAFAPASESKCPLMQKKG